MKPYRLSFSRGAAGRGILWRGLRDWDWVTLGVFGACGLLWIGALALPQGWEALRWVGLVLALTLHSSLSHEILHGHPFQSQAANAALGLVQPGVFVPYLRFRALHLAHHRDARLTDPYEDPESNYMDPAVWAVLPRWWQQVLLWNNMLLGRIVLGPMIGMAAFLKADLAQIRHGDRAVAFHWLAHLPGAFVTLWIVSYMQMGILSYLSACYAALSVLRIRTFLEHRAHERAAGRSVIIEDRGPLAFLFLNNNFHAVHHMHPDLAWYHLPALYRARQARFLQMNQGYVYPSYAAVFGQYLWRRKDPVAHPLWQGRGD